MTTWNYRKPVHEMTYDELAEELVAIVECAENGDVDVGAIEHILDVIDEKYPLDITFRPVEESWAEFCELYVGIQSYSDDEEKDTMAD